MSRPPALIPLPYEQPSAAAVLARARRFFEEVNRRRTVRDFSPEPVAADVIRELVRAASTAPSGAHRQPWTFVAVSAPAVKRQIRIAAEREERENYGGRMPTEWIQALEPLGTDEHKPFLEVAPWLVVLFKQTSGVGPSGERVRHYYVSESVGIAAGVFLTAVHQAGLVALTHTPSPMGFLREILHRPDNETACLLMPVGYPAAGAKVPDLRRKSLDDVLVIVE